MSHRRNRHRQRPQAVRRRALLVGLTILAGLVLVRHLATRDGLGHQPPGDIGGMTVAADPKAATLFSPADLEPGGRSRLIALARDRLQRADSSPTSAATSNPPVIAFVSLSRPAATAWVERGEAPDAARAVAQAVDALVARIPEAARTGGRLKIDLVAAVGPEERFDDQGRARIERSLEGLWLLGEDLLLLPEELESRRLVDAQGDLQSGRLRRYFAEGPRDRSVVERPGAPGARYRRVRLDSFAEGEDGLPLLLFRGNDRAPAVDPAALLAAAVAGGEYLLRHQQADGEFDYLYKAKRDELPGGTNRLRHAGTCYALFELYDATGDRRYRDAARRGIEALLSTVAGPRPEDVGEGFETIVSPGAEAKLGGAALAVLAMAADRDAAREGRNLAQMQRLARFLVFMQGSDGRFVSKYFYGAPDPEPFESIYYPGEAILALARLYRLDPDPAWLEAARRGADYLINGRDRGKETVELPHDHWLLMALDELDQLTSEPHYVTHAERIAEAILGAQRTSSEPRDWIGTFYDPPRSTPTATRAEALVAMDRLAARTARGTDAYRKALLSMASFQQRCQITPVNALYLPRPDRALGGFRRSLTNWEVRIDYVQHNMSALLGLRALLLEDTRARG